MDVDNGIHHMRIGRRAMTILVARLLAEETNFRHEEFVDEELNGIDAYGLNFRDCTFQRINFSDAFMESMTCTDCKFIDCTFRDTSLESTIFTRCSFYHLMKPCHFIRTDLRFSKFEGCDVRLCNFQYARLFKSTWHDTNATGADFTRAEFGRAVEIRECNFRMTDLRDADLRKCKLSTTDFEQANLQDAQLQDADLTSCNFAGTNFKFAKLQGADMRGANIGSIDVRTTDLTHVKLYKAQGLTLLENIKLDLFED
jgi:fluoroquinolone resistance protein